MSWPQSSRFCKKHGYVQCDCPDSMGLSIEEFQASEAVVEAARKFYETHKVQNPSRSQDDMRAALAHLDRVREQGA